MSDALGNTAIFIAAYIVVPWALIFALRLVGRRHGWGNLHAPPQDMPLADRPLRCRLNLLHRWRGMRTPGGDRYQRCLDCGRTRDIPTVAPPP
jgi:hypothetical protein